MLRIILAFLVLAFASDARAQPALKLVVPYAAGGGTDAAARILGEAMSAELGRAVLIENRTGASAGAVAVANAPADGNTLLFGATALAVDPGLYTKPPYDLDRDFIAVAHVTRVPLLLLVHTGVPAKNLSELIALMQEKPGTLNYGSAGVGSILHMAGELLNYQAKAKSTHVPYRGSAPAMTDLFAGRIQFIIDAVSTAVPAAKHPDIRALAVTSSRRLSTLPEVPTFKEAGLPEYEAYTFNMLMAPKGTPAEVVQRLNEAANAALKAPNVLRRYEELMIEPVESTPNEAAAFLRQQVDKWGGVLKNANIKVNM
jgi:tripartite-type tricarboxylate transporter receptor subunit TctC